MNLLHGDCLEVLQSLPDGSVDAVVTDPPYGLSFMGKKWDYDVPSEAIWRECLRVLKPGGHLLAFAGTRTQHRMAVRIEDAGFEIRDMIAWVYGSGFPKSLNVGKAIEKQNRLCMSNGGQSRHKLSSVDSGIHKGWGTALKPALEPITVARKPLAGTVAANVQAHGTGALNIDGCRVAGVKPQVTQGINSNATSFNVAKERRTSGDPNEGRWPANLIHDGSEEVVGLLNGAARFFYCAKASKRDRDEGCEGLEVRTFKMPGKSTGFNPATGETTDGYTGERRNHHPTVKPTDLMRYLCRLVTPPGGVVLDPFMGSGSTGKACALEGFQFIGIEREAEYVEIARARIAAVTERQQEALFA